MTKHYGGPVIDPHHHLWDLSLKRHPAGKGPGRRRGGAPPRLHRRGLPARCGEPECVAATVHVEAGRSDAHLLEESRWLATLDRASAPCASSVSPTAPMPRQPSGGGGRQSRCRRQIRTSPSWHPDPGKSFAPRPHRMADPTWRAGLTHLSRLASST